MSIAYAFRPIRSNASTMSLATCETLIVSPHLDDAVFSCGAMIAATPGALVCTIFAGAPRSALVTDWDTQCGFTDAHEAMRARRIEDTAALHVLDARAMHLGFLDAQYTQGTANTETRLTTVVSDLMREIACNRVYFPLGLFHSDHELAHTAAREACLSDASATCIAYEDGLYRRMNGVVQKRLLALAHVGVEATPLLDAVDADTLTRCIGLKERAVQCYASQLKAFGSHGYDDVFAPERFWILRAIDQHA